MSSCPGEDACKAGEGAVDPTAIAKVNHGEPGASNSPVRANNFASKERLLEHYDKHGGEFNSKSSDDYLATARYVVTNGIKAEYLYREKLTTGYIALMGTSSRGQAKFAFTGTNNRQETTTPHTKSGKIFGNL
ncbi:hypothetical protein ACIQYF_10915 [Pseudomonas sp. NPDC096917]|uniref:hypothetical protein n=1 Tax=Pseudomonas sp. NPDC096917 TaxID=3364483 RepID=UPI00383BB387